MVIQQRSGDNGWVSTHPLAPPKEPAPPEPAKKARRLSVLAVQSLACGVVVLLAVLLRIAGGTAYEQLRTKFQQSLMSNDLLGALATLWDGDPSAILEEEESDAATGRTTPAGALAVGVRVNRMAAAPVAQGVLTSGYGYREAPIGEGEEFHAGVDIAAPSGTPIAAMFYGTVSEVGENAGLGRYIRLCHGGELTVLYAHCSEVLAAEGMVVKPGETVARVGATGKATGNHVHIQLFVGDTAYNPAGVVPLERYA